MALGHRQSSLAGGIWTARALTARHCESSSDSVGLVDALCQRGLRMRLASCPAHLTVLVDEAAQIISAKAVLSGFEG